MQYKGQEASREQFRTQKTAKQKAQSFPINSFIIYLQQYEDVRENEVEVEREPRDGEDDADQGEDHCHLGKKVFLYQTEVCLVKNGFLTLLFLFSSLSLLLSSVWKPLLRLNICGKKKKYFSEIIYFCL